MNTATTATTPEEYIATLDEPRRSEIEQLHNLIRETIPELQPYAESSGIGYGRYHYKYASGREGDAAIIGLASNKNYISLYSCASCDGEYIAEKYREALPKANVGKSCIRFKKAADVDHEVIKKVLRESSSLLHKAYRRNTWRAGSMTRTSCYWREMPHFSRRRAA